MQIIVKSIEIHHPPIVTDYSHIHAHCVLECGPLLITGVAFAQMDSGKFCILFPKFKRDQRVIIQDHEERENLLETVMNTYRALNGRSPAERPPATATPIATGLSGDKV